MFIGLMFRKEREFHGPNARKYSKIIFRRDDTCYRFVPLRTNECTKSEKKY